MPSPAAGAREHALDAATHRGITKAGTGLEGIVWNILGPDLHARSRSTKDAFSWHATFPVGTFVPPHIHPTQDEFIYVLEGRFDLIIDGKNFVGTAGDLIRLPKNPARHLQQDRPGGEMPVLGVADRKLYDLFWAIHSMKEQNPPDVVALSAKHEVVFLPPPPGA